MHLFLPTFDATRTDRALMEVRRIARPGDCLIVMAPIIVPRGLPVDVDAGMIWKQVCRAERHLFHAREAAERILANSVTLRFVRVQARDAVAAIRTGAAHYDANMILLPLPSGLGGALALRFGPIRGVLNSAPCAVRVIGPDSSQVVATLPARERGLDPFEELAVVAVNPAVAHAPTVGKSGGHLAS